jgi:hypothetical protein
MKKETAIIIILVVFFTVCNVLFGSMLKEIQLKTRAELELARQKEAELIQNQYMLISSDDIFCYIRIKNPALSNREISDIVSHAFYLGDQTGADPYGILTIMDI